MLQSAPSIRSVGDSRHSVFPNTKQLRISAAPSGLPDNPSEGRGKVLPAAQPALDRARRYLRPWHRVAGERQGHRDSRRSREWPHMLREMRVHPRDTGQAAPSATISCLQDTDNLLLHEEAKLKRKKVHPAN